MKGCGDDMVTQEYNRDSIQILYLTSSESKPTECSNGSIVIEVDTGKYFRFDKENAIWYDFGYVGDML